jgi:hypothetical protein
MQRILLAVLVTIGASAAPALGQDAPDANAPPDFAIARAWLEALRAQKTFLPTYRVKMEHRSNVKNLAQDCEIHMAARLVGQVFGEPPFVVVEPPNVCKFLPNAKSPTTSATGAAWRTLFDTKMRDKECDVTGFPRLYTEHMAEDGSSPSNPAHVFEVHPATQIKCDGAAVTFKANFRSFAGLRHIKPASAHECISTLRLWVKFHSEADHYEFVQHRSGRCGNMAIVEVTSLPREWIQQTGGGRTAVGRVTANGEDIRTLKLYAIEGTPADEWFARVKDGKEEFDDPRLVHGFLTYDHFSIFRALGETAGSLGQPPTWTEVRFPMAFVILGPTTLVPWQ